MVEEFYNVNTAAQLVPSLSGKSANSGE